MKPPWIPIHPSASATSLSSRKSAESQRRELAQLPDAAQRTLSEWGHVYGEDPQCWTILPLPGGASTRSFFRVVAGQPAAPQHAPTQQAAPQHTPSPPGLPRPSWVLMVVPPPDAHGASSRQVQGIEPFVEVQRLLARHGIPVPVIHHASGEHQCLLVDDLGDLTLELQLLVHPEVKTQLYREVLRVRAQAAQRLNPLTDDSCVRKRAFDKELLAWELEHFWAWALQGQGHELSGGERAAFDACAEYLVDIITSWPTEFVHRDFQSRNLMVEDQQGQLTIYWIDFQDAMLGPRAYDLVALLTDSYQSFDDSFVDERLAEYCDALGWELGQLRREFDLLTIQRKLKDAGRFYYLAQNNGQLEYLPFVKSAIRSVRKAVTRVGNVGELQRLKPLLDRVEARL